MNTLKRISLGLSAVLCILFIATALPVFAEVQVFIDISFFIKRYFKK